MQDFSERLKSRLEAAVEEGRQAANVALKNIDFGLESEHHTKAASGKRALSFGGGSEWRVTRSVKMLADPAAFADPAAASDEALALHDDAADVDEGDGYLYAAVEKLLKADATLSAKACHAALAGDASLRAVPVAKVRRAARKRRPLRHGT
jgi:hypothetical protein